MLPHQMPRIQPVDENGKLLWNWRKELSRKRSLRGTVLTFVVFLVFLGFFILISEVFTSGTLFVRTMLSIAFTSLTLVSLVVLVNRIRQAS